MTTTTHPDVDLGPRVLLPLEDLGRGVRRRPTPRGQLLARRVVVAEAEVCDFDVHVAVHQQVLGLRSSEQKAIQTHCQQARASTATLILNLGTR